MVSGLRVQGLDRFRVAMQLGVSHTGVEGRVRVGSIKSCQRKTDHLALLSGRTTGPVSSPGRASRRREVGREIGNTIKMSSVQPAKRTGLDVSVLFICL